MEPGDILRPADFAVGELVQARDKPAPHWYNAKVIGKTGGRVRIAFTGYPASHNKTFKESDEAIRVPISAAALKLERTAQPFGGRTVGLRADGTWDVERILSIKGEGARKMALVRWAGWGPSYDAWRPVKHIEASLVEAYEYEQETSKKGKPLKQSRAPFTAELTAGLSVAATDVWQENASGILDAIKMDAAAKIKNVKEPIAELRIATCRPVSIHGTPHALQL